MKDGNCPLCKSNEVYMTDNRKNLDVGDARGLSFEAREGRETSLYFFDTYVCLNCGYTAMFAKPYDGNQGLSLLKKAMGWKKAG